ncbi:D-2-hydroxyacid dehydrogenase [Pseudoneobacillus sp. C159]
MLKKKLVITQNLDSVYYDQLKEIVPDWEIYIGKDATVWGEHLNDAEIVAGWKKEVGEQCFEDESRLKWLQSWSAGVNSMPLRELEARGVSLTSASGVHAFPISETIFGLMLALTRKIHTYVKNQQSKTWHHAHMNLEIHGKTIGIIGVGAIGKETAKIAKAFGMRVIGVRHSGLPEEYVDEMYKPSDLNDVLPVCDYVVITLPLTEETRGLLGAEQFKLMKSSAFLINIGRGEIVDEVALVNALATAEIAGAGLDVFVVEPLPAENRLWKLDNVIITPHTAGSTEHYNKRVMEDIFIPNLREYVNRGVPLINLVDYRKGY